MTHDTHAYSVWVVVLTALTAQVFKNVGWSPALGALIGLVTWLTVFGVLMSVVPEDDDKEGR